MAEPGLARGGLGLRQPTDLVNHRLLSVYTAQGDWALWLEAAGVGELASHRSLLFDSYLLALEAAIDGRGVALVPDFVAATDLRTGRLLQPFPLAVPQPGAWYLVCRKERALDRGVRHLRQWLVAEVAADPDLDSGRC